MTIEKAKRLIASAKGQVTQEGRWEFVAYPHNDGAERTGFGWPVGTSEASKLEVIMRVE
jgi:hypothetical protein